MDEPIVRGWKRIAELAQVCVDTARKYARLGMPVIKGPGGGVYMIRDEFLRWLEIFSKEKKRKHR